MLLAANRATPLVVRIHKGPTHRLFGSLKLCMGLPWEFLKKRLSYLVRTFSGILFVNVDAVLAHISCNLNASQTFQYRVISNYYAALISSFQRFGATRLALMARLGGRS